MVSSGQVNSDSSSLKSVLSQYDSLVGKLASSWKGDSHDNFVSKANEFSSDFSSSIVSQMTSFASACDLYEKNKTAKQNMQTAHSNYNSAVSSENSSQVSSYANQVNQYKQEMDSLKGQIESALSSAAGVKLEATAANATITSAGSTSVQMRTTSGSSTGVKSAIDWAVNVANSDEAGYSQGNRWGNPDYDCSSFVITAYQNAGIPVKDNGASYTGNMRNAFIKSGFEWILGNPNVNDLQPGDVLLDEDSHTEMYIGNGQRVGAHISEIGGIYGQGGDQTGNEISVTDYGNRSWDGVLRYVGNN